MKIANEERETEVKTEETLLELLSRSGLAAILPFLDRIDDRPRPCDFEFEDDDSLVHEAFPQGK